MNTEEYRTRRPSDNMVFDDNTNSNDRVFEAFSDRIEK